MKTLFKLAGLGMIAFGILMMVNGDMLGAGVGIVGLAAVAII